MANEEIILETPTCYICGHNKTVSQVAWEYVYPDDKETPFTSEQKIVLPLTAQSAGVMVSLPVVPGAGIHTDYCAQCGAPRCTRVDRISIPAAVFQAMMGMQKQIK